MDQRPKRAADEAAASWSEAVSEVERWAARVAVTGSTGPYVAVRPPPGTVFTVETATENGMHRVVAVRDTEGRRDPADDDLAELRSVVRALLDLAGHEEGRAGVEVVLTAAGPHIVACELGETSDITRRETRCDVGLPHW